MSQAQNHSDFADNNNTTSENNVDEVDNFTLALVNLDQAHFNMPSFIILIAAVWWFTPAQPVEYGYCMSGKCKHINLVAAILPPASVPATGNKAVSNRVAAEETLRSQGMNIKIASRGSQEYFGKIKIFRPPTFVS